jgi:hypothetical protein
MSDSVPEPVRPATDAEESLIRERCKYAAENGWKKDRSDLSMAQVAALIARIDAERQRADKLQAFKSWTHGFLDSHGVPYHPPGTHGAAGCRIGDRMDFVMKQLTDERQGREAAEKELAALRAQVDEDDGPCVACGKPTHRFAGDPGQWPVFLPDRTHTGCVLEALDRLKKLESGNG